MISVLSSKLKTTRDLQLQLTKEQYLSGEELVGRVQYNPKKAVNVTSAKVYFCGAEFCAWTERVAMRTGGPVSSGDVQLFKKEQALVHDRTRMDSGPHVWNFRFVVPRNIPPSCIYRRGQACVAYFIKVKVCTGFGHFDMVNVFPVVIGQLWIPIQPVTVHNTEEFSSGDKIRMNALCSHSVAKCDERVRVHVEFTNESHRDVEAIRIKMKQVWECSEVFHHKNTVLKFDMREGFPVSRGRTSKDISFTVPSTLVATPTISNSSLFKCTYYIGVYLVMKVGGLVSSERISCRLPIIVSNLTRDASDASQPAPLQRSTSSRSGSATTTSNPTTTTGNISRSSSVPSVDRDEEILNSAMEEMLSNFHDILAPEDNRMRSHSEANLTGRVSPSTDIAPTVDPNAAYNPFTNPVGEEKKEGGHHATSDVAHALLPSGEKKDAPISECIICFDGPKNMLLLPCAHIATCITCTAQIVRTTKTCPVCRAKIAQVLRTYQV